MPGTNAEKESQEYLVNPFWEKGKGDSFPVDLGMLWPGTQGYCVTEEDTKGNKLCVLFIEPPPGYSFLESGRKESDGDLYIIWGEGENRMQWEFKNTITFIMNGFEYKLISVHSTVIPE